MTNLNLEAARDEIKATVAACDGTPTAKLVAVLIAAGITDTKEIAAILDVGERAVQKARKPNHSSPNSGTPNQNSRTTVRNEPQFANHSSAPNHSSPKSEPQFVSEPRVYARIETPSGLVISSTGSEVKEDICAVVTAPSLPLPTNPRALGTSPRMRGASDELALKFEQWWSAFPAGRKRAKGRCRQMFIMIAKGAHHTFAATADRMIEAARTYAETRPDPQYVPMPLTWLNQGRWEDDPKDSIAAFPRHQAVSPSAGISAARALLEARKAREVHA